MPTPTVADLISARLTATGMDDKVATRLTGLILKDLRTAGYTLVLTKQLDFLIGELGTVQSNLKIITEAWHRLELQRPA